MKIAVCFKLIKEYDQIPSEYWRGYGFMRPKAIIPDTKYIKTIFGLFDEGALETGLRLKEIDSSISLEAICLGEEDKTYTGYLYADGYDKVSYLYANSDFDSKNTAKELASYIKSQDFDLILTGENVGPLSSGSIPYLIANFLNCPILSKVSEITIDNNSLIIVKDDEDSIETYHISKEVKPIIAIISNAKYPYLRFANYRQKEKTKNIPAKIVKAKNGKKNVKLHLPENTNRAGKIIGLDELVKMLNNGGQS